MLDSSSKGFQTVIHSIEEGKFAPFVKGFAALALLITVALLYLFIRFTGFDSETAMDQAQISRAIASGEGFSTKFIRPLALWQLDRAGRTIPSGNFPDFLEPPLWPVATTIPLLMVKKDWKMDVEKAYIYTGDRAIAGFTIVLFLVAVVIGYFVARRLFDAQVALLGVMLVLVTDLLWKFSLSGLPQIFLMLLLLLASWAILRAMSEQQDAPQAPPLKKWLLQAGIGALFALMTLSHWVACWFFVGYLFFAFFYFRPRFLPLAAIVMFAAVLAPWIFRTYSVSGHPFGIALFPITHGDPLMRSLDPDFDNLFYGFRLKMRMSIVDQMGNLFAYLGLNIAAGAFFVALFHPFKRPETAKFRWCVLAMWVGAVIGMAAYGPVDSVTDDLQLHAVFIPLMVFYGLAFLLVLWNRLGFQHPLVRTVFNTALVIVAAIPMIFTLFSGSGRSVSWPPYVPPYIAALGNMFEPREAVCSDMPWAVAWYADRKCLLLPDSPKTMVKISDFDIMGAPICGLFLTPITGDAKLTSEILRGSYKQWAPLILRMPGLLPDYSSFPLRAAMAGPIDGQTVIYADRDRWSGPARK
ncbi:MAG: glycosyltransferase family 39 protein [Chthoniobacterales bacterium]